MADATAGTTTSGSRRGASRKVRVYVFREWLLKTYGGYLSEQNKYNNAAVSESKPNENTNHQTDVDRSKGRGPKKRKRGGDTSSCGDALILDVAGGKGDLSWLLKNADGLESIVLDPWKPDPKSRSRNERMTKSIEYLRSHPEEATKRSIPFLPTYQPLAALMPRLLEERRKRLLRPSRGEPHKPSSAPDLISVSESHSIDRCRPEDFLTPRLLQVPLDEDMVQRVQRRILDKNDWSAGNSEPDHEIDTDAETSVDHVNTFHNTVANGTAHSKPRDGRGGGEEDALGVLASGRIKLIVGFHPDQATEPCVDLARVLGIPFCIVPCCVFPSEFPNRRLRLGNGETSLSPPLVGGTNQRNESGGDRSMDPNQPKEEQLVRVRTYNQFLEYLRQKPTNNQKIHMAHLDFPFTETAKNIVLYTLPPSS